MNLEIVTPDSKVFEGEITSIALPGIDGSFQILNNHAPIVSALGTGKMTVVDAEYQFDRNKLTFFFEAEGRIDFRELVRDLFSIYKTRIWMQQVNKDECEGKAQ